MCSSQNRSRLGAIIQYQVGVHAPTRGVTVPCSFHVYRVPELILCAGASSTHLGYSKYTLYWQEFLIAQHRFPRTKRWIHIDRYALSGTPPLE